MDLLIGFLLGAISGYILVYISHHFLIGDNNDS